MQALLATFAPEVQVRAFDKGLLIRREGEEWYFEKREDAMKEAGQGTTSPLGAAGGSANELGVPTPNTATLELYGFRGVRTVNGKKVKTENGGTELTPEENKQVDMFTRQFPLL